MQKATPAPTPCQTLHTAAVCLVGGARSFLRPHVHRSIHWALDALAARVDVFATLSLEDAPVKRQGGWAFAAMRTLSTAEVLDALAPWDPRAVDFYNSSDAPALVNRGCTHSDFFKAFPERLAVQLHTWANCMAQIEAAERVGAYRYDIVVRTRPDAYWRAAHPPVCVGSGQAEALTHVFPFSDQHFVMPRSVADGVLSGMHTTYKNCSGRWREPNGLNPWLMKVLWVGCAAFKCKVRAAALPFALVRDSAEEPSARSLCCASCAALECAGCAEHTVQRCGTKEQGASNCTTQCMAAAYPGKASRYHTTGEPVPYTARTPDQHIARTPDNTQRIRPTSYAHF